MIDAADMALIEIQHDALPEPGRSLVEVLIAHVRELEAELEDKEKDHQTEYQRLEKEHEEELAHLEKVSEAFTDIRHIVERM